MGIKGPLLLIFIVIVESVVHGDADSCTFKRSSFPDGFLFGSATSAYQYEGAWNKGGKGPSNWDHFTQTYPERVTGNASGEVALNYYHLYPNDTQRMKDIGLDAVRISFSWSRILPDGRVNDGKGVNFDGLAYYHKLINSIISQELVPFVTLFHFDLPQALEEEYGGFLNHTIVKDFQDYADFCFSNFSQVKYWITMNEPWSFSALGYAYGTFPPGRCSNQQDNNNLVNFRNLYRVGRAFSNSLSATSCPEAGNSSTEPYIVTHHLLLAHAYAVKLYRKKYQTSMAGKIGIVQLSEWMLPYDAESKDDKDAANRALDFMYGWFMEPLTNGTYPSSMVKYVGKRLPTFGNESEIVKGSFDFIGINYYTSTYAKAVPCSTNPSYLTDSCTASSAVNNVGHQIGPQAGSDWLYIYPQGLGELLVYTKNKYSNPVIYITENGVDLVNGYNIHDDLMRIKYHNDHLCVLRDVINNNKIVSVNKVDVRGYFVWSFMDNFEWTDGYTVRFGLVYVDYFNEVLARIPKSSAKWFKKRLAE